MPNASAQNEFVREKKQSFREVSGKFRVAKVNIQSPRRLSDGQWPIYPADWATKTKAQKHRYKQRRRK